MAENKINEDHLLLLIESNGKIETSTITIDDHFQSESDIINNLCEGSNDNINEIIQFITDFLKPKLPNKIFNYCKELDKAFQSVHVNVDGGIKDFSSKKELIFTNQKKAIEEEKEFNLDENIKELKSHINQTILLWFKVFNTEFAYEKAKAIPNMLVFSHRISGWSKPEYRITENLSQELKTNFGYGSVSYFYSLFIYKGIQITPLSEWIDYRYSRFSDVIRYTRSFRSKIPVTNDNGNVRYFKIKIENFYWNHAIEFTKNAANLSIINEKQFIDKYIISECERMVIGLDKFYKETEFEFIDEDRVNIENDEIVKHRVDIKGFELIDFRTEKIIGALDFLSKIYEYNSIIPTAKYSDRIISLNKKFIPNVYYARDFENSELAKAKQDYDVFIITHNKLLERVEFYDTERVRLKMEFAEKYGEEFSRFQELLTNSVEKLNKHNHKLNLHTHNIKKLTDYITKYNEIIG